MNKVINHIYKQDYTEFLDSNTFKNFDEIFKNLKHEDRYNHRQSLFYLNNVLNYLMNGDELKAIHLIIHCPSNEETKSIYSEFLWHFFFTKSQLKKTDENENKELLNRIDELKHQEKIQSRKELPYKGPHTTGREYKKLLQEHHNETNRIARELRFYSKLSPNRTLQVETLLNMKVKQSKVLEKLFSHIPAFFNIEKQDELELGTHVLINEYKTINEIADLADEVDDKLDFYSLQNLIVFDCSNQYQSRDIRLSELLYYNETLDTSFKNIVVLNFQETTNLKGFKKINKRERENILDLKEKNPEEAYSVATHMILKEEIEFLEKRANNRVEIEKPVFLKPDFSSKWEDFLECVKYETLYELRSIKMLNVFSICYNQTIKDYILSAIFNNDSDEFLISSESKILINELSAETKSDLKSTLESTLDFFISENNHLTVKDNFGEFNHIVLDYAICKNKTLRQELRKVLSLKKTDKLVSWNDWKGIAEHPKIKTIILSYRDQGKFPNSFYPNIYEQGGFKTQNSKTILPGIWFANLCKWSHYLVEKGYWLMLNNEIRRKFFAWDLLKEELESYRPDIPLSIDWDQENYYRSYDSGVKFKVFFKHSRPRIYAGNDYFIYQIGKGPIRIDILENIHDNNAIKLQELREFIEEFNPAEKIIDTESLKEKLRIVKKEHGIDEIDDSQRLWKILLNKQVSQRGLENVFKELSEQFNENKISMVSLKYFENTWINPESTTVLPKGKKEFRLICKYLNLGITYMQHLYVLRNRQAASKGHATRIYSKFLTDIFNDALFDKESDFNRITFENIEKYKRNHDLDELGINSDKFLEEMKNLIALIRPSLRLVEIETIIQENE